MTIDTGQWTLIPSLGELMIYFVTKAGIIQKTTAWEDTAREGRRLGWQKSGGESLISYQTTGSFFHQEHSCCVSCRRKCLPECICTWSLFLIFLRIVASELLVLDHRQRSQQQLSRSSMATLTFCLSLAHSPGFQKEQSHSIHRSEGTTLWVCMNLLILTDTQTRPICSAIANFKAIVGLLGPSLDPGNRAHLTENMEHDRTFFYCN